jgi:hypothetical protein
MTAPNRPTKLVVTGMDGMRGGVVAATWCQQTGTLSDSRRSTQSSFRVLS